MSRWLLQAAVSLLAIASLMLGTASACICPHHQHQEERSSIHSHPDMPAKAMADEAPAADADTLSFADPDECVCEQIAAKIVARPDIVNLYKQVAAVS